MQIVGILTEFNPFHSGHAYLFQELRKKFGEDIGIVCIMSGNFVQRGAPAMFEKHVRAEAALRHGADVVIELPVARVLSSAESFAQGAVYLMQQTGCITHLAFGSECADITQLSRVAACLESEEFRKALPVYLKQGEPFAICRRAAVRSILGDEAAELLDGANNNLGVEYLKAARRQGWDCTAVTIKRRGAGHDSCEAGEYLSASALRSMLLKNNWETVEKVVPENAVKLYRKAFLQGCAPVTVEAAERMILAKLRTMSEKEFAKLPDCGEGLYHRLYQTARKAVTLEEFLMQAKTKRYALSRLRRMVMCAWLEIDCAAVEELPQYLRVLGCSERGRNILAQMRKSACLPVLVKPADVRMLSSMAQKQFEREARATERYTLLYPSLAQAAPGQEWRKGPVVLKEEKKEMFFS